MLEIFKAHKHQRSRPFYCELFKAADVTRRQGLISKDATNYGTSGHLTAYLEDGRLIIRLQGDSTYTVEAPGLSANQGYDVRFLFGSSGMKLCVNDTLVDADDYPGGIGMNYESLVIGANAWASSNQIA